MVFSLTTTLVFSVVSLLLIAVFWPGRKILRLFAPKEGSQYTTIHGTKIHYILRGHTGPSVLLIHGIAAHVYCWRNLIPLLADKHKVWALDLKGFGLSDKPLNSDYSLRSQAELVRDFIKKVIKEKVILVGSSMGGAISLELALKDSEMIEKLILLSPAYDDRLVWLDPKKVKMLMPLTKLFANAVFAKTIIKSIYGKKIDISHETVQAYLGPYLQDRSSHYALMEALSSLTDKTLKERMKDLKVPTLFVWGQNDKVVPIELASGATARIPHAKLVIHPDGGHHIQEEEPEWVAEQIINF